MAFLKKLGLDVHSVIIGDKTQDSNLQLNPEEIPIKDNVLNKITRYYAIYKILCKLISPQQKIDIIYIRSLAPNPFTWIAFQLPRRSKIITEYQTIEPIEAKLSSQKYHYFLMDFLFGRLRRKKIDAIVGVTDEITRYELKRSGEPDKPHITIGNGFDVESVPVRNPRSYNNTELHLLCVANVSKGHGLDRILSGIASYEGDVKIVFHIVGDGNELSHLKQMAKDLKIQENVIFYGFLSGEKLDEVFNSCHVAIGGLAGHRQGLSQASDLKTREYCARGIPFIVLRGDSDFSEDCDFIAYVPTGDGPIDIQQIIEFAQKIDANPNLAQEMRKYAIDNLDWSIKMIILKKFLESLVVDKERNKEEDTV